MNDRISVGRAGLNSRRHALYRFFDRSDVLLYVGITVDMGARFKKHGGDKPWWPQIDHIGIEWFETRQEALEAERNAITEEQPLYNTTHNSFIAEGPITPEQAVAEFAEIVMGKLNIFDEEAAAYMSEADEAEYDEFRYPMPKVGAAALLAAEDESGGRIMLSLGARHVLAQIDPNLRDRFEQRAMAEASNWGIDTSGGLDEPEVMESALCMVASMLAKQYLETLDPDEAAEWIECARVVYQGHDDDALARMAATYARQRKHNGAVPPQMCLGKGEHGAGCPRKAELDVRFTCDEGHVSEWYRYCGKHSDKAKTEGVQHQACGTTANVSGCVATQALNWGWVLWQELRLAPKRQSGTTRNF